MNPKSLKSGRVFNLTSQWKRIVIVGCSHGEMIDQIAKRAVLDFVDRFKPDKRVHLGDFIDTTAFRGGARDTADEGKSPDKDMSDGLRFLKEYRANIILCGNHEARLWKFRNHRSAIVTDLVDRLLTQLHGVVNDLGADFMEYRGAWNMYPFRNYKLAHGYMYSENSCRDHAEAHGNIIHAHTHRACMAVGRRDDDAMGFCVGTLTDIPNMEYASYRRATLGWSQGLVYGFFNDKILQPYLCVKQKTAKEWILPAI